MEAYRRLLPEDLIDILTMNGLHYSAQGETGALFYMLGAISSWAAPALLAIGNSASGRRRLPPHGRGPGRGQQLLAPDRGMIHSHLEV